MTDAQTAPKFTDLEMEAALCSWEHLIEQRESKTYAPLFDQNGTAAMRTGAIYAGAIALGVYDHMEAQGYAFVEAYDFEFIPAVMDRLDWQKLIAHRLYSGVTYAPSPASILDQLLEAMPNAFEKSPSAEQWMQRAEAEADRLWSYAALISDHREVAERARKDGDTPEDFAKALGEELDLIPAKVWTYGA